MKKFVILLLICLCFLLCSCSADTSGYQNELTCTDWSAELDGGGKISLSILAVHSIVLCLPIGFVSFGIRALVAGKT